MTRPGVAVLTALALSGFAANSLLCRAALAPPSIDAASFTLVRIASGALVLALLVRATPGARVSRPGSWRAALALFAYAVAFSFAYVRIRAGTGALILFGCVQLTMVIGGRIAGERARPAQLLGLAIAFGGLIGLVSRGLTAPDPVGAALMAAAGVAWGVYSLLGRGGANPLAATERNFRLALVPAVATAAFALANQHLSLRGAAFAAASGGLASGVAYSLWYAALRDLRSTAAAVVQLSVPVLTAAAGVLLLDEPVTTRLVACGATVLAGIALAVLRR